MHLNIVKVYRQGNLLPVGQPNLLKECGNGEVKIYIRPKKTEAHGPQRSPECTCTAAIFNQNTVNVACKKN